MSKKCVRCEKASTFDVPEPLCDEHWADWWVGNDLTDLGDHVPPRAERDRWKAEILAQLKADRDQQATQET